jgi:hypothetical protein
MKLTQFQKDLLCHIGMAVILAVVVICDWWAAALDAAK